jgi:hypothetical protein
MKGCKEMARSEGNLDANLMVPSIAGLPGFQFKSQDNPVTIWGRKRH